MIFGLLLLATSITSVSAQKYMTRNGTVHFKSNAEVEDGVEAYNRAVGCVLNTENGELAFQLLIKGFTFQKALMQEHFNENYMESDKFPKATFKGKITNLNQVDFSKNGTYNVTIEGDLTIKEISKPRKETAKLIINGDQITLECVFQVANADHNIKIPSIVADKVAKIIDVDFKMELKKV